MSEFEFTGAIRSGGATSFCEIRIAAPQTDAKGLHYCAVELSFPRPRRTNHYGATRDQAETLARNYVSVNLRGMVLLGADGREIANPFAEVDAVADTPVSRGSERKRGRFGVLISLVRTGDGARLIFDDAEPSSNEEPPPVWRVTTHFTSNDYNALDLLATMLSESQLADIGLAVIARLAAWENMRKE